MFVVQDSLPNVAVFHAGLAEAVVGVCGIWVNLDVQCKNRYGIGSLFLLQKSIARGVQRIFRKSLLFSRLRRIQKSRRLHLFRGEQSKIA